MSRIAFDINAAGIIPRDDCLLRTSGLRAGPLLSCAVYSTPFQAAVSSTNQSRSLGESVARPLVSYQLCQSLQTALEAVRRGVLMVSSLACSLRRGSVARLLGRRPGLSAQESCRSASH